MAKFLDLDTISNICVAKLLLNFLENHPQIRKDYPELEKDYIMFAKYLQRTMASLSEKQKQKIRNKFKKTKFYIDESNFYDRYPPLNPETEEQQKINQIENQ